jgi:putative flippase GtrA
MLQYSAVGICAAIVDITSIQYELYCKLGVKYSAHRPVYAVCTVVPVIYNAFTAPHIRLQYSTVGICAAIVDITTIECA